MATYIVGINELLMAIVGLFVAVGYLGAYQRQADTYSRVIFAIQIVFLLLYIFLTILLFYGLRTDQATWVFVHCQATASIVLSMFIYVVMIAIAGLWAYLPYYILVLIIFIFFIVVEYRCYQHMRGI